MLVANPPGVTRPRDPFAEPEPLTGIAQCAAWFQRHAKPPGEWRVGIEAEKLGVRRETLRAIPYSGRGGVEGVLRGLRQRFGWRAVREGGRIVRLERGAAQINLEPGGQVELSGSPCRTLHEVVAEWDRHLEELRALAGPRGVAWLGLGAQPVSRVEEIEWVPKGRYRVMSRHMASSGPLAHAMMKLTAAVQVSVDYADEGDAARKLGAAMALSPLAIAMFANSPFRRGRASGYLSWRAHIWTRTDPARCGLLRAACEGGMGFREYAAYAWEVPLYFVRRRGRWVPMGGIPFGEFVRRGARGERATMGDWALHLTTLFPEVRLKGVIEVRSADAQGEALAPAVPALWKGILYDAGALEAAARLVGGWRWGERRALYHEVARTGLRATVRGRRVGDLARELCAIAEEGLRAQGAVGPQARDERHYLAPLRELLRGGRGTPAEILLSRWRGEWGRDLRHLAEASAI